MKLKQLIRLLKAAQQAPAAGTLPIDLGAAPADPALPARRKRSATQGLPVSPAPADPEAVASRPAAPARTAGPRATGAIHSATLSSPRLRRVLKVLSDGQEHSTLDLIQRAQVCAVNTIMSELRAAGIPIPRPRRVGGVYYWRLRDGS